MSYEGMTCPHCGAQTNVDPALVEPDAPMIYCKECDQPLFGDFEIESATKPFTQHDACDDCGKRTDGLMTCYFAHDDSTTKLCPDCIKDSGFCLRCGHYCAGMQSFDFSDMPGYCSDCRDEIQSEFEDDEEENYDPNW